MKTIQEQQTAELETLAGLSRRHFFQYTGGLLAVGTFLSACSKSNSSTPSGTVDLGMGDIGLLNYAYALEQLEAAFYTQVVAKPYSGISASELGLLADIWAHEVAHREFFKNVLASSAIQALTPNFSSIDFTSRTSVLTTAQAFENLGVSAYNGAAHLFTTSTNGTAYLGIAGKIVSVEARHAAYLNDLISYNTFATTAANGATIDSNGLDAANAPSIVAQIANKYLSSTTQVSGNNLPK
jgi:hypothetical protein